MKVYFQGGMYESCYYVRCLLPLRKNKWLGDKLSIYSNLQDSKLATQMMLDSDIVVFQRPFEKSRFEIYDLLRESGKKIVFDNDDTYKVNDQMKLGKYLDIIDENIDEFIRRSDLVTASTEFLANEYKDNNKNVIVLPNCIDPADWKEPIKNDTGKIRIGIVGSVVSTGDFKHVKPVLKQLSEDPRIQLVVFGLPPKNKGVSSLYSEEYEFWLNLNIEWQPFVRIWEYANTLRTLKLDLMLIPREDSYFNRAKSNLKFLEASMLEIPVIAQGFSDGLSPYQGKDEKYMKIVIGDNWLDSVYELVNDKERREQMGMTAKEYVLENYDINKNAHLWIDAYKTI